MMDLDPPSTSLLTLKTPASQIIIHTYHAYPSAFVATSYQTNISIHPWCVYEYSWARSSTCTYMHSSDHLPYKIITCTFFPFIPS